MRDLFKQLLIERPTGTENNEKINSLIESRLAGMGYDSLSLPFDCKVWEHGEAALTIGGKTIALETNPFSRSADVNAELIFVSTMDEMRNAEAEGKILCLSGEMSARQLSSKDFPFYYPDEDKEYIELIEEKAPAAIIAATGKAEFSGQNPFPLFEDANFLIPSAVVAEAVFNAIKESGEKFGKAVINSRAVDGKSRQLIARNRGKKGARTVMLCAHCDSKYNTVGALDNAAGVCVLLEAAKELSGRSYNVQIVPFNSEEYFGVCGELAYLGFAESAAPDLVINIDSPCHKGAGNSAAFFNFEKLGEAKKLAFSGALSMTEGEPWYSGDHAIFAFSGKPTAVISSDDLFCGGLNNTHTPRDAEDEVDLGKIKSAAEFAVRLADSFAGL